MKEIIIYREHVPEKYEHTFSIVIKSKDSERTGIEAEFIHALRAITKKYLQDIIFIDERH